MSNSGRARVLRGRTISRATRRARWWSAMGVVILVAANVTLVALLLERPAPADSLAGDPDLIDAFEAEPVRSATPEPTSTVEPPAPVETAASQYLLAALSDEVAWRATTGTCPEAAVTPQLTTDGGASWQTSDATSLTGITAAQRILASSSAQATFIGFDSADCSPTLSRTFVGGQDYATDDSGLALFWWLLPTERGQVHSPERGVIPAPCTTARAIAVISNDVAGVLCGDGTLFTTGDAAATFTPLAVIPGAQSVVATESQFVVAALGQAGCEGVAISTTGSAGGGVQAVGCLPTSVAPEELVGRVALSIGGGTLWVWAGDQLTRSTDLGVTWR